MPHRSARWSRWLALGLLVGCGCSHPTSEPTPPLNSGRSLLPPAGPITVLGDMPMTVVPSADGRTAVVLGTGYRQAVYAVSTVDGHQLGRVDFPNDALATTRPTTRSVSPEAGDDIKPTPAERAAKSNGVYYGLCVVGDTVYAAQGAHDAIAALHLSTDGTLALTGSIPTAAGDFPAGLAADSAGRLYVSGNGDGGATPPFDVRGSLTVYDPATSKPLGRFIFDTPTHTSNFPLGVAVRPDGRAAYVASERDGVVYALDTTDPAHIQLRGTVPTGSHPTALLLSADAARLFVANSQSDTISVIDTATLQVVGTVLLRPGTSRGPTNATPINLALSPDGRTLYVALADLNAVGVVDVASLSLAGLIPAGHYPSAVLPTAGGQLLVVSARGHRLRNPNSHYDPFLEPVGRDGYVLNDMPGDVQLTPVPTAAQLADDTAAVLRADHLDADAVAHRSDNPLLAIGRAAGGITHVIYVVKENRTYDQVLGDDARGNGAADLCLFGRDVTPNQHALADRFVLLDNCYACGDVSGDGWVWSTQGTANAYVARNVPYQYSGRGRMFDYEGQNNGYITAGFPAKDPDGKPLADAPGSTAGMPPIPDVAQSAPHLWDAAARAGVTYRNYGFYLSIPERLSTGPGGGSGPTVIPENYPTVAGLQPPGHDGAGRTDADFRRFDPDYADSDAPRLYFEATGDRNCLYKTTAYGKYGSPSRFAEWNREFQQMLAKDPSGGSVPNLMFVRLPHDHTQGLSRGHHTPASEVADNDYAVGQLVEAVSKSPIWPHTAIFIIEDDAQSGPDHVDCHRTTAYVISPFIRRGSVDRRFNNTDTLLRTMELLLGLDPLCAFDAAAVPLTDFDTTPSNAEPYVAVLPAKALIAQVTPAGHHRVRAADAGADTAVDRLADASDQMDFAHADAAPADALNRIVWASVRGTGSPMPPPRNTLPSPSKSAGRPHDDDGDGD